MSTGITHSVKRWGHGWAVFCGQKQVSGATTKDLAEEKCADVERKARQIERPCITCQQAFLSDGAHQRMCNACRRGASAIFDGAV